MTSDVFARPERICDLVMKGGVTSGVVYPLALCELAKTYRFKNIGGTSAGAIAAAAAAAAEDGRRHGSSAGTGTAAGVDPSAAAPTTPSAGFDGLAALPAWIGQPGRLLRMFQPDPPTRALFALLMAGLNPKTRLGKAASIVRELIVRFPITALVLVLIVWAIQRWFLADISGPAFVYTLATTIALAIVLFVEVVLLFLYRQITQTLPANFYGMSRAYDARTGDARVDAPLTN
jgi:Patatin-like phospholipase